MIEGWGQCAALGNCLRLLMIMKWSTTRVRRVVIMVLILNMKTPGNLNTQTQNPAHRQLTRFCISSPGCRQVHLFQGAPPIFRPKDQEAFLQLQQLNPS